MFAIELTGTTVTAQYSGTNPPKGFIVVENNIPTPEVHIGFYPELHYTKEKGFYYEYRPMNN